MCIVAIAWKCFDHPDSQIDSLPLVLLGNRDEFFDRPTTPLNQWEDATIIGGRDEKSGGTWLGINPDTGKWATVLNVREVGYPQPDNKISRGKLVSDYLSSNDAPREFARKIDLTRYDGFNLILGNREQAFIISNRGQALESLPVGLHVFSNGQMTGEASHWAKCEKLRGRVRQEVLPLIQEVRQKEAQKSNPLLDTISSANPDELRSSLFDWQTAAFNCLRDNTKASLDNLPDTGLPAEFEQKLSSVFIERLNFKHGYGTRVSSVLALRAASYDMVTQAYLDNGVIENIVRMQE